ncbi:MAG: hypothetical protein HXL91_06310 [[Eubacterium] sulci]|nr:hypothetical protein [[Eubacterium] sulci]
MASFVFVLLFYFIGILTFLVTLFMYFRLAFAVIRHKEVPRWIYKLGQALQGRMPIKYDNVTDLGALVEASFAIITLILTNLVLGYFFYQSSSDLDFAIFKCLKLQLFIVLIHRIVMFIVKLIYLKLSSNKNIHLYSPVNAILGGLFITSFVIMLCLGLSGYPEKPVTVQISNVNVTIGSTQASDLLSEGFSFVGKTPNSDITNMRNDHFYYGERAELIRNGKSYGYVYLTPKWNDTDKLKDCVITHYRISGDNSQLSEIKINNIDISKLNLSDFKSKDLKNIYSLDPLNSEEIRLEDDYTLVMQTNEYSLWKRYRIEAKFYADGKLDNYSVGAQYEIWE